MKVVVTGGAGVGQFGIISSYNSGTKLANVTRESTGASGWDHFLAGTNIVAPDASSTYIVEPRITFTAPGFTDIAGTGLTSQTYNAAGFVEICNTYVVTATSGTGTGNSFTVIKNGWKYDVSIAAGGNGYTRLDTLTILGSNVGGTDGTNDITITVTSVDSDGTIQGIDVDGYGSAGAFVALANGSTTGFRSVDGQTWSSVTLPSASNWQATASGKFDDGSTVGKISKIVAVASGTSNGAYSDNGTTWTATALPASANWVDVCFDSTT